ncbi:MAG: hypothetical protein PHH40_00980 [Candidatus Moranbacteria bacterium]|nr:hypothetical protein [Candidatus Moranbacteria bacterium]MDD3964888.1 hypothetical protein [Candidatus Moranbacteria bacterium]
MLNATEITDISSLITEEAGLLHAHDPKHELLKYLLSAQNDSLWNEFLSRFGKTSITDNGIALEAYNEYYFALHRAVQSLETSEKILVHDDVDSY